MTGPRELLNEPFTRVALRGRLTRPWWRRRFHAFGAGSVVHRPDWVYGPWQIAVGSRVIMLHGLWLSVERPAWELPGPVLRIGDGVAVRPYCTISAAESVDIEENVVLSAFCTVLDSDHSIAPEGQSPLWTPLRTAPTRIGAGTWVGERTAILRGADVGRRCIIGANSVVKGDIPDGSIAAGAPARVVGSVDG
jgi:lipopolysaccharide O-acetyltransferase